MCSGCGAVQCGIYVVGGTYSSIFDEDGNKRVGAPKSENYIPGDCAEVCDPPVATLRSTNSAPYKRQTYFSERVSQWRMQEPDIDEDDWLAIETTFFAGKFTTDGKITKEDVRSVLRAVDNKLEGERPRFVRKYLEKFLTIRYRLSGLPSYGRHADGQIVFELKNLFAQLQVPFDRLVRHRGTRYSFPNYNFVFRRCFDLLGCNNYNIDFPPLKSYKKREDIICIWIKLIRYLNWPYINSDAKIFGPEYFTQIPRDDARLNGQRQQQQQHTEDEREDTDDGHSGLRGEHRESESTQCTDMHADESIAYLLASLSCTYHSVYRVSSDGYSD